MKRTRVITSTILLGMVVLIGISVQAALGQPKTFSLKFASPNAPQNDQSKLWDWWAQELDKRTGGRVKTTMYHAGTLGSGPEVWENILKGIADVGAIGPFTPGKHPVENHLTQILPFRIPSPRVTGEIFWNLYQKGLLNHEIGGYKFLYTQPASLYILGTTKKKLTKLEDFKGLRIRVPGESPTLKAFGVGIVASPPTELYSAIERGIVDGMVGGGSLIASLKMEKLMKYVNIETWGAGNWYVCMNKKVWDSFPADIQAILTTLNNETYQKDLEVVGNTDRRDLEIWKAAGADVYRVEPAELKRWKELTANLMNDWVKEMDGKGLPGTQIKTEVLRVLRENGVDPEIR